MEWDSKETLYEEGGVNVIYEKPTVEIYDSEVTIEDEGDTSVHCKCAMGGSKVCYPPGAVSGG